MARSPVYAISYERRQQSPPRRGASPLYARRFPALDPSRDDPGDTGARLKARFGSPPIGELDDPMWLSDQ
jgi:hypothetical protein